jgi:selenocysteine lyase/cysteine desulfurase
MNNTFAEWRSQIQVSKRLHLNHAGVSPMSQTVATALQRALLSQHNDGPLQQYIKMFEAVPTVREMLASLIGVPGDHIGLTRNTSHAMSILANGLSLLPGSEVVVAHDEFPGIVYPWIPLERDGIHLKRIHPAGATFTATDYIDAFTANTKVVIVSWVHWCTGCKIDIDQIVSVAKQRGIVVICDTIQGLGSIPIDFRASDVDFIIGGSHKWLTCPSGLGYIAASPNTMSILKPTNIGWNSVENSLDLDTLRPGDLKASAAIVEEGNPSFLTIVGSHAALTELTSHGIDAIGDQVVSLASTIAGELRARGWTLRCSVQETGLVCAVPPSSVLRMAARLDSKAIDIAIRAGAIRFSPHAYQTINDLQPLFDVI